MYQNEKWKEFLLTISQQNWDNARHHEANRWKYTYYYYAAFAAALLFSTSLLDLDDGCCFNNVEHCQLAVLCIIWLVLGLIGLASFYHLLYANIEYKNCVRINEFIGRDLEFNKNIAEYRKAKKTNDENTESIDRYTYMALPLMLGIRKHMPFQRLTLIGIGLSFGLGLLSFLAFISKAISIYKIDCLEQIKVGLWILVLCLPLVVIAACMHTNCKSKKFNDQAEKELNYRDPREQLDHPN